MKKISIALSACFVIIMAACSSNEESTSFGTVPVQQKDNDEFQDLYDAMVSTQDYIDHEAAITAFVGKMNYTGYSSDLLEESRMLGWISANISTTGFSSYGEAVSEWDNVKSLGIIVYRDNDRFFGLIPDNPGRFLPLLPNPQPPYSTQSCPGCGGDYFLCSSAASSDFSNSISSIATSFQMGTLTLTARNEKINNAKAAKADAMAKCDKAFEACCNPQ